jgi:uncharacterized membrane protein YtjA (UPF0391 family)
VGTGLRNESATVAPRPGFACSGDGDGPGTPLAFVPVSPVRALTTENPTMLRLALLFLVIALVAGLFGFTGIEVVSIQFAQITFFVFLVLAVVFFVFNAARGAPPRDIV